VRTRGILDHILIQDIPNQNKSYSRISQIRITFLDQGVNRFAFPGHLLSVKPEKSELIADFYATRGL